MALLRFALVALLVSMVAPGCASGGDGVDGGGGGVDVRMMDAPRLDTPSGADAGTPDVPIVPDTGGGGCTPACDPDEECCGGACVDVNSNANHCGRCSNRCEIGTSCMMGMCGGAACMPACDMGETCTSGMCRCGTGPACTGTQACCSDGCVDTNTNASHCGACGRRCAMGATCVGGVCSAPTCSPACLPGEACVGGMCLCGGVRCSLGQMCCSGRCSALDTVADCGACGRTCAGTESCCSGACINTSSNPDNCGGCGRDCDSMTADGCTSGVCTCRGGRECAVACIPLTGCFPL